uniref:FYVE-type domain-containing protein n=1 Tax=Spongospora subterranea TaxID=70186 RepID=A0A0H5QZC3_9EUKA|eukprot:CRZ00909.1 hypothetical protein [Spongospora subterranea]
MGQAYSSEADQILVQWDRDSVSDSCSLCSTAFTTFNRRHHCRSCGILLCGECSPYTSWLPQLGYNPDLPQRVCERCSSKSLTVTELEVEAFNLCKKDAWKHESDHDLEHFSIIYESAKRQSTFNSYLLDRFRTRFAILVKSCVNTCLYDVLKASSDVDLRTTVAECIRVGDLCSRFRDDLDVNFSELSAAVSSAKKRIVAAPPVDIAVRSSPSQRLSAPVIRVKKVRFASFEVASPVIVTPSVAAGRLRTKSHTRLRRISLAAAAPPVHGRASTIVC